MRIRHAAMLTTGVTLAVMVGTGEAQAATWKFTKSGLSGNDHASDVVALGRGDAWAVGGRTTGSRTRPLVYRWNGKKWRTVKAPGVPVAFGEVDASSAKNVWAFGTDLSNFDMVAARWNGTRWTTARIDNDLALYDADVVSAGDVWLAGEGYRGGEHNLKHWNGRTWRNLLVPGQVFALHMTSARNGWAVGQGNGQPSILRWNGTRWKPVPAPRYTVPHGGRAHLLDVVALGPNNVWAVGTMYWMVGDDEEHRPIAMRWNGRRWSKAAVGAYTAELTGLAPDGRGGLWASLGVGTTLLHYQGGKWTRTDLPRPSGADTHLSGGVVNVPGTTTMLGVGSTSRWGAPENDNTDGIFYTR